MMAPSEQLAARLKELAKSLELDEPVVVTWTHDEEITRIISARRVPERTKKI